jgi:cytoskeletal protein CcmA (bactofilin family)
MIGTTPDRIPEGIMWKKGETDEAIEPSANPTRLTVTKASGGRPHAERGGSATIGPSITIRGDVTGDEDLMIQGSIEGTVTLKQHNVTVGAEGTVKADIHGRTVTVEGNVVGDLHGEEQVVLRQNARLQGNIQAPRVTLEDGARFRGGIDMGEEKPAPAGRPDIMRRETVPKEQDPGPLKILESKKESEAPK